MLVSIIGNLLISITGSLSERRHIPNVHHCHYHHNVQTKPQHIYPPEAPQQAKEELCHYKKIAVTKTIS